MCTHVVFAPLRPIHAYAHTHTIIPMMHYSIFVLSNMTLTLPGRYFSRRQVVQVRQAEASIATIIKWPSHYESIF